MVVFKYQINKNDKSRTDVMGNHVLKQSKIVEKKGLILATDYSNNL